MKYLTVLLFHISIACIYTLHLIPAGDIPNPDDAAKMARYIIHNSDWAAIATISRYPSIEAFPYVSLESISDGPINMSTGVIYFYITNRDEFSKDIEKNNRVSVMATMAESSYCTQNGYDPEDPRCSRVMINGFFEELSQEKSPKEFYFARGALLQRHPAMNHWPINHDWYIGKLQNLSTVLVFDAFGGIKNVKPTDYFKANISSYSLNDPSDNTNKQIIDNEV